MATVFISHASADTDVALRVERWLTDAGHTVLLDRSVAVGHPASATTGGCGSRRGCAKPTRWSVW